MIAAPFLPAWARASPGSRIFPTTSNAAPMIKLRKVKRERAAAADRG